MLPNTCPMIICNSPIRFFFCEGGGGGLGGGGIYVMNLRVESLARQKNLLGAWSWSAYYDGGKAPYRNVL